MSSTSAVGAASESSTNLGDLGHAPVSNAPSPRAASSDLTPAPEAVLAQVAPQSQPMADHATNVSDQPNDGTDDANAASGTYGTRSRHRPGRARPNYADDKEIDLEIEATGKYPKASKRTAAPVAPVASIQDVEMHNTRNGALAMNEISTSTDPNAIMNGAHGNAPTSHAASKKRKQPGSNVTVASVQPVPPVVTREPRASSDSRAQFVETNVMSFSNSRARLNKHQQLVADDGTHINVNDHLYFVCEPPGEPYYFGRIMEFLHVDNDSRNAVDSVRVNWFYRPKDIQRRVQDTRVVFASMHSDVCPLTAMRGKCYIKHLAEIPDLEEFRKQANAFWFDKLYDRYMHRYYEVIPTSKVVNVPRHVKKVLDERWKFVLVEVGRGRDLTAAVKVCKRCSDFAANHESVDCAVCKNTYHMSCVRPPLLKKPARGFAWACAACSRAQELKMEARHTPMSENEISRLAEAESFDEDEDSQPHDQMTRENSTGVDEHPQPTAAQLAQANLWPWRYLGIHSRPEDALDIDDRIYPRASSRLGPRHQANINVWHGKPVEFIKPAEAKKRYKPLISSKKDAKAAAALENDKRPKRPKWVFDEPTGFIHRGQDEPIEVKGKKENTAQLIFMMPDASKFSDRGLEDDNRPEDYGQIVEEFLQRCDKELAPKYHLGKGNVDLKTKALEKLQEANYKVDKAWDAVQKLSIKTDLKLPDLTKEEIKRFEEGVSKYGSELHLVARHVSPTIKEGRIVRFYYQWKKTPRGKEIWGSYEGRKSKKDSKRVEKDANGTKLMEDVADDADDSAFDDDKASRIRRSFKCKFCFTTSSRVWRRAPATAPGTLVPRDPAGKGSKDKSNWLVSALCGKCAYLWRRYAVQYESIEEIGKKIAVAGGRAAKRKVDEEMMRIVLEAQNFSGDTINKATAQIATTAGIEVPLSMIESDEAEKKKIKPESKPQLPETIVEKKVVPEKPVELEPLSPDMPRVKEHPCAVCHIINHPEHRILKCRDCRLHVHAPCYGLTNFTNMAWYCDMCKNDYNTQVSTNYECVLCPIKRNPQELMEPPKVSHKKKTDREREKERKEREMVQEAGRRWREDQLAAGRPVDPREPLKRTAWNNWVHVNCAVWTEEIKFGDVEHLDSAEGVGFIPRERFESPCKFCNESTYPTVNCQYPGCNISFHVGCAHQRKLVFGFDITPVKMSRRDSVSVLKLNQESGLAMPGIWCVNHTIPTIVHTMLEPAPSGLTALQEYVRTYKNVDSTTTGTVRRAAQFDQDVQPSQSSRATAVNGHTTHQNGSITERNVESPDPMDITSGSAPKTTSSTAREGNDHIEKSCCTCRTEHSPKWWKVVRDSSSEATQREGQQEHTSTHDISRGRAGSNAQPISPLARHLAAPMQQNGPHAHSTSGLHVKPEPIDIDAMEIPETIIYQCHKCHVHKKPPPESPPVPRRTEATQNGPVQSPRPVPMAQAPPQGSYSTLPPELPQHSHSHTHPVGISPHIYPTGVPWPTGPLRNGHGPAPVMYGGSSYHTPGEFRYPYPPPPGRFSLPGDLTHPSARPNGLVPQGSPPAHYVHPLPGQPPPALLSGGPSSHVTNGHGSYPGRPTHSHSLSYEGSRGYGGPPSLVSPRGHASSISHAPQAATDQVIQSRAAGQDGITTPRLGITRPISYNDSPRAANQAKDEIVKDVDRDRDARTPTAGPGASASPSLKNLLS